MRAVFFGLGADGTVGANKNSIKIIGEETDNFAQGYFVYDSKKSGAVTISHLRFGPEPIRAPYLISQASFVGCHQFSFLERYDVLESAEPRRRLPPERAAPGRRRSGTSCRSTCRSRSSRSICASTSSTPMRSRRPPGMGTRINTIMQTCFFAISGVLPRDEAIAHIKHAIEKTYTKRGADVVQRNFEAVDATLAHLQQVAVPASPTASYRMPPLRPGAGARFRQARHRGDAREPRRPAAGQRVSGRRHLADRHVEVGEAQHRGGNPGVGRALCIQCNKCALVCPHAAIRVKVYPTRSA